MKRIAALYLVAAITFAGAAPAFAQDTQKGRGNNMPTFSDIDLNSDGAIVAEELYQMRGKRMAERAAKGGKLRNAANAPSFEDIDTDSDGKVSPDEFSAYQAERMARHQKPRSSEADR
jgi:EF hand